MSTTHNGKIKPMITFVVFWLYIYFTFISKLKGKKRTKDNYKYSSTDKKRWFYLKADILCQCKSFLNNVGWYLKGIWVLNIDSMDFIYSGKPIFPICFCLTWALNVTVTCLMFHYRDLYCRSSVCISLHALFSSMLTPHQLSPTGINTLFQEATPKNIHPSLIFLMHICSVGRQFLLTSNTEIGEHPNKQMLKFKRVLKGLEYFFIHRVNNMLSRWPHI